MQNRLDKHKKRICKNRNHEYDNSDESEPNV